MSLTHPLYRLLAGLVQSRQSGRISQQDFQAGLEAFQERLLLWEARLDDPALAPAGALLARHQRGVRLCLEALEALGQEKPAGPALELALQGLEQLDDEFG